MIEQQNIYLFIYQDVPETLAEYSTLPNDTSAQVNGQVETTAEDKNTTENPQTDLEENQGKVHWGREGHSIVSIYCFLKQLFFIYFLH